MESAQDKFMELYKKLYENIEQYKKVCLSTLVPMKGKKYDTETVKLMVVGRATNGWGEPIDNSVDCNQYSSIAWNSLKDPERFKWVEKENEKREKRYNVEASPFWNYSKAVLKKLRGSIPDTGWRELILWSNLFPVSFSDKSNPSDSLKRFQFDTARELLKEQIRYYQPSHVLIMTDWNDWFFVSKNEGENGEKFLPEIEYKGGEVIKGSGSFGDSYVVVTRRPDYYNKEKFVNDIVAEFKNL